MPRPPMIDLSNGSAQMQNGDRLRTCVLVSLFLALNLRLCDAAGLSKPLSSTICPTSAFGSRPGASNWNDQADLNEDEVVDVFDLVLVGLNYG